MAVFFFALLTLFYVVFLAVEYRPNATMVLPAEMQVNGSKYSLNR